MFKDIWWEKLKNEVILNNLCTQCGSCVGLSNKTLEFRNIKDNLVPVRIKSKVLDKDCYSGCPARFCNYPNLNFEIFGKTPENWLCGNVIQSYIGYSKDREIRRNSASGGVTTSLLVELLESGKIQGAICIQTGRTTSYKSEPIIAKTSEKIRLCSQSVYSLTPTNTIIEKIKDVKGPLAFVGLPDQVASIRKLQSLGNPEALKIKYIIGLYMGTQMHLSAISGFLKPYGVKSLDEISKLNYRAGEWPGYLSIILKSGEEIKVEKFYYNYLIPLFITQNSLQIMDFTNELADISIGDAWSPKYENKGKGYSVVLGRTRTGINILKDLEDQDKLSIDKIPLDKALEMHGHMLDFKKRGSFIRNSWNSIQPDYGYEPVFIPSSRLFIEYILYFIFTLGKLNFIRNLVTSLPISVVGPTFNFIRKSWKSISKPTKRKGLKELEFRITNSSHNE